MPLHTKRWGEAMKYVISWTAREGGSGAENEEAAKRGLQVFGKWSPPQGDTFHQFLTRLVKENRRQTELLVAAITRLEGLAGGGGNGAGPTADGMLVATATGSMLHRPDCPIVVGREGLRQLPPDAEGFEPCKICDPLVGAAG